VLLLQATERQIGLDDFVSVLELFDIVGLLALLLENHN
jgi:hypothetical protein